MSAPLTLSEIYGLGRNYEDGLGDDQRRRGAHFTPVEVATALVQRAGECWFGDARASNTGNGSGPVIWDPACGGGVFLVAAAEYLRHRGFDPAVIVDRLVMGTDVDPLAVEVSRRSLVQWALHCGVHGSVSPRVTVGDALDPGHAGDGPSPVVDMVVGNPPFQNQLKARTSRSSAERSRLRERFGDAAGGYADTASLFVLRALEVAGPKSVIALILPRSFLVARDSRSVRDAMLSAGSLRQIWIPSRQVFDASVYVCAPILHLGPDGSAERIDVLGDAWRSLGDVGTTELGTAQTWSPLWATAHGVPDLPAPGRADGARSCVGDVAVVTAGFRDEYYGVVAGLTASAPRRGRRVASTAMVDPGRIGWSDTTVRIGGRRWTGPWLDLDRAEPSARLVAWLDRVAAPKVLVATQSKVIEAGVDSSGDLVPLTPLISVTPLAAGPNQSSPSSTPVLLGAALTVPAASAWALRNFGGGGLSGSSMRLAARQIAAVPLPVDAAAWRRGAELLEESDQTRGDPAWWFELGTVLNRSWGVVDDDLTRWWMSRLPALRGYTDPDIRSGP